MLYESSSAIPEPGYRPEAWDTRRERGRRSRAAANVRRMRSGRMPPRAAALIRRGTTRLSCSLLLSLRPPAPPHNGARADTDSCATDMKGIPIGLLNGGQFVVGACGSDVYLSPSSRVGIAAAPRRSGAPLSESASLRLPGTKMSFPPQCSQPTAPRCSQRRTTARRISGAPPPQSASLRLPDTSCSLPLRSDVGGDPLQEPLRLCDHLGYCFCGPSLRRPGVGE